MVTNRLDLTPSTSIYKASQFTKKVCEIGDYLTRWVGSMLITTAVRGPGLGIS